METQISHIHLFNHFIDIFKFMKFWLKGETKEELTSAIIKSCTYSCTEYYVDKHPFLHPPENTGKESTYGMRVRVMPAPPVLLM